MLVMWAIEYDIIVETLTGTEIEVTLTDDDTAGYIKLHIQKYEGIPFQQQHLIYNQRELNDDIHVKNIPLAQGSRLKLVLGLKGGPVVAKRRLFKMPDLDSFFDMNTVRQDQFNISPPVVKLIVYKDGIKNMHCVRLRSDCNNPDNNAERENSLDLSIDVDDKWKMHRLSTQFEAKKRNEDPNKSNATPTATNGNPKLRLNSSYENNLEDNSMCDDGAIGGTINDVETDKASQEHRRFHLSKLKEFNEDIATSCQSKVENSSLFDRSKYQTLSTAVKTKSMVIEPFNLNTISVKRCDDIIWQTKVFNNSPMRSKKKLTKSNWIQNLVGIIKNSKAPLSTGELFEIKETFKCIKESLDTTSSKHPIEKPHSKVCDIVQKNRCFDALESNDDWRLTDRCDDKKSFRTTSAKAIADSSSLRVLKMSTDAKKYELHRKSSSESFHTSNTNPWPQRCDSPKNILPIDTSALWEQVPAEANTIFEATIGTAQELITKDSVEFNRELYVHRNDLSNNLVTDQVFGFPNVETKSTDEYDCKRIQNSNPSNAESNYNNNGNSYQSNLRCADKEILGNTNYGYADYDLIAKSINCGELGNSSNNNLQDWRRSTSYGDEVDYSCSNWKYDKESAINWNSDLTYQSDDSFCKFDSTVDDIFRIDSLNLLGATDSLSQCDQSYIKFEGNETINTLMNNDKVPLDNDQSVFEIPQSISSTDNKSIRFIENNVQCDRSEKSAKLDVPTKANLHFYQLSDMNKISTTQEKVETKKFPPENLRCAKCNKKLGVIMIMKCHCEKNFCAKHRYAETHNCSYDFKKIGRQFIAEENPLVIASKITKI